MMPSKKTLVMGIVNITPDSFSKDGRLRRTKNPAGHAQFAQKLVSEGADIIDFGGESSRPGAVPVSLEDELHRVIPAIRSFCSRSNVPVSIDTYKPVVAKAALEAGASIVNNILGTAPDKELLEHVKDHKARIVVMHSRGTPQTMQSKARYKDVVKEVITELRRACEFCLEIGIKKDRIIIDPGFGFAKTISQNFEILNRLDDFKSLGFPILVGTSRKSFIASVVGDKPNHRIWGTAATVALAIARGADIVRVHDVAVMNDVASMTDAVILKKIKK